MVSQPPNSTTTVFAVVSHAEFQYHGICGGFAAAELQYHGICGGFATAEFQYHCVFAVVSQPPNASTRVFAVVSQPVFAVVSQWPNSSTRVFAVVSTAAVPPNSITTVFAVVSQPPKSSNYVAICGGFASPEFQYHVICGGKFVLRFKENQLGSQKRQFQY